MIIPNIWKNKKCSKPPTRKYIFNAKKTSFTEQAAGSWGDIAVHFGYNESFVIKPTIWVTIMISQWT
jgi:hypothetical protein